ncbi:MAG: hypothetical protein J6A07_08595 [Firmicutes bacterium]|nr:hypothetical protein [Bacillota bacterium]
MWGLVKLQGYETPYGVTGTVKHTGSKDAPKDICTDRNIGTWKDRNAERLSAMKRWQGKLIV